MSCSASLCTARRTLYPSSRFPHCHLIVETCNQFVYHRDDAIVLFGLHRECACALWRWRPGTCLARICGNTNYSILGCRVLCHEFVNSTFSFFRSWWPLRRTCPKPSSQSPILRGQQSTAWYPRWHLRSQPQNPRWHDRGSFSGCPKNQIRCYNPPICSRPQPAPASAASPCRRSS